MTIEKRTFSLRTIFDRILNQKKVVMILFLMSLVFSYDPHESLAQDQGTQENTTGETEEEEAEEKKRSRRSIRRSRYREKKAEGTKAKKRGIRPETIKSQYRLNGRRLDVDPD